MSISHDTNHSAKVPQGWSYFLDDPSAPVPPELEGVIREVRMQRRAARKMLEFQRNYRKMDSIESILAAFKEASTVSSNEVLVRDIRARP